MQLKRTSRMVMITGTLLIWAIKFIIRPGCETTGLAAFLLGIAPNLVGSFLIPFAACWFFQGRAHFLARLFSVQGVAGLRGVCVMGFGLVVINEFLQLYPLFGRTFDVNDLVFSLAGTVCSYFVFNRLQCGKTYPYSGTELG